MKENKIMKTFFLSVLLFALSLLFGCKTASLSQVIEEKYGPIGPAQSEKEHLAKMAIGIKQDVFRFKEQPWADLNTKDFEGYRVYYFSAFGQPGYSIRFQNTGLGPATMNLKGLSTSSTDFPAFLVFDETKTLSDKQWLELVDSVNKSKFWEAPFEGMKAGLTEGAYYLMEGYKDGKYHVISRTPNYALNPEFFHFYSELAEKSGIFEAFGSKPSRKFRRNIIKLSEAKNPEWSELKTLLKPFPMESERFWGELEFAVRKNNLGIVKGFLSELTYKQIQGAPCYRIISSSKPNYEILKMFLKKGFDPNLTPERVAKWNPAISFNFYHYQNILHRAIENQNLKSVRLLLKFNANPNFFIPKYVEPPLFLAVETNQEKIVTALLDAGANINAVDSHGRTPLLLAQEKGNHSLVQFLLKRGADPNILPAEKEDEEPVTRGDPDYFILRDLKLAGENYIFHLIRERAGIEAIKAQVAKGVDINQRSKHNTVPLMEAHCYYSNCNRFDEDGNPLPRYSPEAKKFFEELEALGAKIPDDLKLAVAFIQDDYQLFDKLLKEGVNPNIMVGDRPLIDEAISMGMTSGTDEFAPQKLKFFYRLMEEPELDINIFDLYYGAPVFWVLQDTLPEKTKLKILTMLLAKGADPNARSMGYGFMTPLHFIVSEYGDELAFLRLFLKNGANPSLADDSFDTPLDCANTPEEIKLLKVAIKKQKKEKEK